MKSSLCMPYEEKSCVFLNRLEKEEFLGSMTLSQLDDLSRWKNDEMYCTCSHDQVSGNEPISSVNCSSDTVVRCAKEDKELSKYKCRIRTKRSSVKHFSHKMFQIQNYNFGYKEEVLFRMFSNIHGIFILFHDTNGM